MSARQATAAKAKLCTTEQEILESHLELESARASEERRVVGITSHSDSFRFPPRVLESMCAQWDQLAVDRVSVHKVKAQKITAPPIPSPEQQQCFLDVDEHLKLYSPGRHWWCQYVCTFRDHFRSTALYKEGGDDDGALVVYCLLFAKQNPFVAVFFLELRQVARDDVVHGDLPRVVFGLVTAVCSARATLFISMAMAFPSARRTTSLC